MGLVAQFVDNFSERFFANLGHDCVQLSSKWFK
jgi:hypothetical protein